MISNSNFQCASEVLQVIALQEFPWPEEDHPIVVEQVTSCVIEKAGMVVVPHCCGKDLDAIFQPVSNQ